MRPQGQWSSSIAGWYGSRHHCSGGPFVFVRSLFEWYLDGCSWAAADVDGALSPCRRLAPRLLNRIGAFCLPPFALACFAFTGDGRPPADILQFDQVMDLTPLTFVSLCRHCITSIYVRWKPTRPTSFGTLLLGAFRILRRFLASHVFILTSTYMYAHQGE